MTKIEQRLALVGLIERQRRFEWQLARDAQARAAGQFVAGKTHDLLNMVQIVELASLELSRRCGADAAEFIADLMRAADDAKRQLVAMMAVARPEEVIVPGAPVGAALGAALETVRPALPAPIELQLTAHPEVTTRCTADELAHLIYGLILDAAAGEPGGAIQLVVRERTIEGKPWLEIVRGAATSLDGEHFDLRAVEAIAVKSGGELAHSERRGGGTEVIVALPLVS